MRTNTIIDRSAILSILRGIAGLLDYRAIIGRVSTEVRPFLEHVHLDVALVDGTGSMVTAYETGLHTEWDVSATPMKAVAVSPIRTLFYGHVDHIVADDAQNDVRFHFQGAFSQAIFEARLRSRLHVALKVEGKVIGALSFSTQEVGSYGPAELETAKMLAEILSSYFFALQQSRLLRESELAQVEAKARAEGLRLGALKLTEELEDARQAIGMDLHDQTLADLARVARTLDRLADCETLSGSDLEGVRRDIDACVRELRVIVDDAKPSMLQFFGFGQAVEALLEAGVATTDPAVRYQIHDDGGSGLDDLPSNTLVALYRIIQEAINNALRHAEASNIEVRIGRKDGTGFVAVEDDGRGLPSSERRRGGLGNMGTRAALIGANLSVAPGRSGRGTRLEICLPSAFDPSPH